MGNFSVSGNPGERPLRLYDSIIPYISALRLADLDVLQVEVLGRLIGCRRNNAELVEEICGTPSATDGCAADYYRVRRATRTLEEKGFISAPLFGREKAYHLTRYGISVPQWLGCCGRIRHEDLWNHVRAGGVNGFGWPAGRH